jgi:small-conductance mechanosensitive channel
MESDQVSSELAGLLPALLPTALVLILGAVVLALGHWLLIHRRPDLGSEARLPRQLIMFALTVALLVALILSYPFSASTRGQLIGLLGILITAVIGLSSTTFVANAMAGWMLRAVRSFRPGDFIRVGEHVGRVTERGLFHTEIQTEDRDLVTLPNMHMVTNAVAVVRASGTIVSTTLSLGYDVDHARVEPLLKEAAGAAGLEEPFVQVTALGDFSVTYRAAGFLAEVKHLLTVRSDLRRSILDALHGAGIEIVSPTFMNQRALPPDRPIVPAISRGRPKSASESAPEARVFDKAEAAAELEALRTGHASLKQEIADLQQRIPQAEDQVARSALEAELSRRQSDLQKLQDQLDAGEAAIDQEG